MRTQRNLTLFFLALTVLGVFEGVVLNDTLAALVSERLVTGRWLKSF